MRTLAAYKVDAFTTTPFSGNAAGVVPDAAGLTDREMQQIANEMNVSETAFLLPPTVPDADMRLRYFTPTSEIRLCGHATIATFHLLAELGRLPGTRLKLQTNVGVLDVSIEEGRVFLASDPLVVEKAPEDASRYASLLGLPRVADPLAVKGIVFVTVDGLDAMAAIRPDLPGMVASDRAHGTDGIVAVSFETDDPEALTHIRYFVPSLGIAEDPVTGVAHMALAGYLLQLGRLRLPARFVGEQGRFCGRPGQVLVEAEGEPVSPRVRVGGRAVVSLEGQLRLP